LLLRSLFRILSRLSPRLAHLVRESVYTLNGWRFDDLKKHIDDQRSNTVDSSMALEYTLRAATEFGSHRAGRVAFVTCLPPQNTGISTCSLYSWLGYEGPVDIFCPVVDLDWFFYLSGKLRGQSGKGPRLFDVAGFLTMDRATNYDHIIVAAANSNHNVYILDLLKKLSTVGLLSRVTLYIHDPCLLNVVQRGARLNAAQFARAMGSIYRKDVSGVAAQGADWTTHAALIERGIYGPRYFYNAGIERFLVNSQAAAEILHRDLSGTSSSVTRIFHPVFLPAGAEEVKPQPDAAFKGITVGTFGIPARSKGSHIVAGAARRLVELGHDVRLLIAGFHAGRFAEEIRHILDGVNCEIFDGPADVQLVQCMQLADLAVQLRMQDLGESSGIIPQLLHLGKTVIVSDIGAFKEYGNAVRLVPRAVTEETLAGHILDLAQHPIDGAHIKQYVDEHTPAKFQRQLSELFGLEQDSKTWEPVLRIDRA
jgi:glycosyltransferase involved in cell wall biosynthesis